MDRCCRSDVCAADTAHQLTSFATHHHHLGQEDSEGSQQSSTFHSLRKRSWPVFRHEHLPRLDSVPTDCEPLIRSGTSTPGSDSHSQHPDQEHSITDKYGSYHKIIHYGVESTIRLHEHQASTFGFQPKELFAIKVYRYLTPRTTPTSHPHAISSRWLADAHPSHPNILPIVDLLFNDRCELCLVMPYCGGGDLRELISRAGPLPSPEADCLVAQILRGLAFLHGRNTVHQDIRLETILLTVHGAVKLAGFGDAYVTKLWEKCALTSEPEEESPIPQGVDHACFRSFVFPGSLFKSRVHSGHSDSVRSSPRIAGSARASFRGLNRPYLSPEAFDRHRNGGHGNDSRPADVWAAAIVYMALITGRLPWLSACQSQEDSRYLKYLNHRGGEDGYPPIEALGKVRPCRLFLIFDGGRY